MKNLKKAVINIALILSIIMGIFSIPVNGATLSKSFTTKPMVAAGNNIIVGLKADGTVIIADTGVVFKDDSVKTELEKWKGITQISVYERTIAGLKEDGTVLLINSEKHSQADVDDWSDIVQVATGRYFTVGLKSDGTV